MTIADHPDSFTISIPDRPMLDVDELMLLLRRIRASQIEAAEFAALGHRVMYRMDTGRSVNVAGMLCDPADLEVSLTDPAQGYRVR